MFGPTCVPSPAYESVNVTVELEFKKSGGGGKSHKLELRHPDTDIFSNNGFFSRSVIRYTEERQLLCFVLGSSSATAL